VEAVSTPSSSRTDWAAVVRELAPRFAARAAAHDAHDSFVADNYAELRERRVFSAGVPAELGGGGATYRELADLLRTLAHACSSTALALSMHAHILASTVWRWRHEGAPVEPLLRRVATDELVLISTGGADFLAGSGTAVKVDASPRARSSRVARRAATCS
jgi:alkylation response protein AidB-like acyl-CoA dehydrogenase